MRCRRRAAGAPPSGSSKDSMPTGRPVQGGAVFASSQQKDAREQPSPGPFALLVRQPRRAIGILGFALIAWALLAWLAIDMSHPLARLTMPGSPDWSVANGLAILAMWAVMMAAMMLPSALPMILTFVDLSRRGGEAGRGHAFVAAYLAIWFVFSAAATLAQWVLQRAGWVDPMIVSTSTSLTGVAAADRGRVSVLAAQAHVPVPLPHAARLSARRVAAGVAGAFVMGVRHGLFCVGCCWALMALLFVGGVMNLAWIAALSVAVALEKLLPGGERLAASARRGADRARPGQAADGRGLEPVLRHRCRVPCEPAARPIRHDRHARPRCAAAPAAARRPSRRTRASGRSASPRAGAR